MVLSELRMGAFFTRTEKQHIETKAAIRMLDTRLTKYKNIRSWASSFPCSNIGYRRFT